MIPGLTGLLILFLFLGTGLWVGSALAFAGLLSMEIFSRFPVGKIMAMQVYCWNDQFPLVSLPLFILMGTLIFSFKLNEGLYRGVSPWVSGIPGRLLHSNIVGCTLFAAISGSSTATLAAVGTVSIPELTKLGYDRRLILGTIAGAGTLGLLIPPSIVMIVYCVLINESIGQMYLGGFIPGVLLAGLFMLYIIAVALLRPEIAPAAQKYTWRERGVGLIRIGPTILLIIAVLGGLYMGWSTASEAAAVGCGGGIILGIFHRTFSWKAFSDAVSEAILISGMMLFIITGAAFYGTSVAYLGFSNAVMDWILSLGLSKWTIFVFLVVIYLILGCLMDGGSMLVLTIPIIYPTVQALQWDPIWFGVVLVILIEIAQITPPIGLNLYVLSGITNEPIGSIVIYSLPFFFIMMLMIVILALFPELATWLPSTMITRV